ncbi:ScbA/BarX family gamma-butyrolactone biosynthesis protein [Kitasatospora azatica]|uniref:ScbA/BarX family gamma-butyrolactone biosynthesis protein n=1 Tax=Kitasatospora azatica TaxID=58347 RepID=UPI00068DB45B|nr:ScbA/BarX family gamma-butyrolactone biosynthesis protein [Kitasatospora azatica]
MTTTTPTATVTTTATATELIELSGTTLVAPRPGGPLPLSFAATVNRALVHRDALSEVFVTDLREAGDLEYAAAAQLPRSHAYYGDHLLRPGTYDPVLLLEVARQVTLAGAHEFYDVPANHKFILTFLRIHLLRPQLLTIGDSPLNISLRVKVTDRKVRNGSVTGLDHTIELLADGTLIGWAGVGLRFRDPQGYRDLRLTNRSGAPLPTTAALPPQSVETGGRLALPVAPHLVGRADPKNVVLLEPTAAEDATRASLRIPAEHPSLFDHPQDHLPGMVLAEGARQLALFTALDSKGLSTAKTFPVAIEVTFSKFGELEAETVLSATVGEERATGQDEEQVYYTLGGTVDFGEDAERSVVTQLPVQVDVRQNDESIAKFTIGLARVAG